MKIKLFINHSDLREFELNTQLRYLKVDQIIVVNDPSLCINCLSLTGSYQVVLHRRSFNHFQHLTRELRLFTLHGPVTTFPVEAKVQNVQDFKNLDPGRASLVPVSELGAPLTVGSEALDFLQSHSCGKNPSFDFTFEPNMNVLNHDSDVVQDLRGHFL